MTSADVFLYVKNPVYTTLRKEILRHFDNIRKSCSVSLYLSETCTSSFQEANSLFLKTKSFDI